MLSAGVSGLPVVDDTCRLLGLITEGDLLRRTELGTSDVILEGGGSSNDPAREFLRSRSWKVGDVMSPQVITIEEDTPVRKVAVLLGVHRIKRLPVIRDGRLVGLVSRADLLKVVAAGKPEPEVKGDDAARRAIVTRLQDALVYLSRQPTVDVAAGRVRVSGTMRSSAERDAIRLIVESVAGPGFDDRLEVEVEQ